MWPNGLRATFVVTILPGLITFSQFIAPSGLHPRHIHIVPRVGQSRTQSLLAFWSAGQRQQVLWNNGIRSFSDWSPATQRRSDRKLVDHEIRPIRVCHLRGYSRPGSRKICGEMYSTTNDPETANDPKMDLKWYFNQVIPKVDRKWIREKLRNGMDFMGLIMKKEHFSLDFWRKREGGRHISLVYWGIQSRAPST